MRKQFISATAATLCALCLGFAASAAEVAQYSLTADNAQVTAGNIVELSLRCDSAATPTAALSLQFTLPEGYAVYDVDSGSGIVSNELSYSYTDSTLNVLYLDNDAGGSPVEPGSEVAKIKLTAATPGTGRPLVCIESDASLVTAEGKVESQDIDLTISDMTVTGEAVPVPTTVPSVSTDGKKQTMAEASSNAASESATMTERLQEQQAKQNGDAAANELPPHRHAGDYYRCERQQDADCAQRAGRGKCGGCNGGCAERTACHHTDHRGSARCRHRVAAEQRGPAGGTGCGCGNRRCGCGRCVLQKEEVRC